MKKEDKKDFKIKFGNQVYNDFGDRICMEENCCEKAEYKAAGLSLNLNKKEVIYLFLSISGCKISLPIIKNLV